MEEQRLDSTPSGEEMPSFRIDGAIDRAAVEDEESDEEVLVPGEGRVDEEQRGGGSSVIGEKSGHTEYSPPSQDLNEEHP